MGNSENVKVSNVSSVYDLIDRILPSHKEDFLLKHVPSKQSFFEIFSENGKIIIQGNDNVSLSYGFNFYLRYYLNFSCSWCGNNINEIGKSTILPIKPIKKICKFQNRYYLNYCTHSYSMAFWTWERWEKEIDWMALHGINLVLTSTGQQAIWKNTMQKLNFSIEDIRNFLPGPGFEAWWLMQNLEGWGGPISNEFIDERMILQQKIIKRLKEFDIQPILQCFYGMVPRATAKLYPNSKFIDSGKWQGFERPLFLDPEDELYDIFSKTYYEEQFNLYGDCYFFGGDPFHELAVGQGDIKNLESVNFELSGKKIYNQLRKYYENHNQQKNKKITWILQAWESGTQPKAELLKGLKQGEVLVLDLFSDALPQWGGVDGMWSRDKWSYEGHNWLWCVLDNFGGTSGIFGRINKIIEELPKALEHPLGLNKMKGIGATMEGIERNCIGFDLLFDIGWDMENFKIEEWMKIYIKSRYGDLNEDLNKGWMLLKESVLNIEDDFKMGCINIMSIRPTIFLNEFLLSKEKNNIIKTLEAWNLFINNKDKYKLLDSFNYDLVDLTRQVIEDYLLAIFTLIMRNIKTKNFELFNQNCEEFLNILDDLDEVLGTRKEFLLGVWINQAFLLGKTVEEKKLFVWNAKQQITLWGFNDRLADYAKKDWNGLISSFYKKRWILFFSKIKENWELLNIHDFKVSFFEIDKEWIESSNKNHLIKPKGISCEICHKIYFKIYDKSLTFFKTHQVLL